MNKINPNYKVGCRKCKYLEPNWDIYYNDKLDKFFAVCKRCKHIIEITKDTIIHKLDGDI